MNLTREFFRKERNRVKHSNDRSTRKRLPHGLGGVHWGILLQYYDYRCAYCGQPFDGMDHIIPIAMGGGTTPANVVPCCIPCNQTKGARVWLPGRVGEPVSVTAVLTDGERIFGRRVVAPSVLGRMNKAAQTVTEGLLWWELDNPHERCVVVMG